MAIVAQKVHESLVLLASYVTMNDNSLLSLYGGPCSPPAFKYLFYDGVW